MGAHRIEVEASTGLRSAHNSKAETRVRNAGRNPGFVSLPEKVHSKVHSDPGFFHSDPGFFASFANR